MTPEDRAKHPEAEVSAAWLAAYGENPKVPRASDFDDVTDDQLNEIATAAAAQNNFFGRFSEDVVEMRQAIREIEDGKRVLMAGNGLGAWFLIIAMPCYFCKKRNPTRPDEDGDYVCTECADEREQAKKWYEAELDAQDRANGRY